MSSDGLIGAAYLIAAVLLVVGLKGMASPRSAVRGNLLAASGMLVAVLATLTASEIVEFLWIGIGLAAGAGLGAALAFLVRFTAMPQLVATFNGFGGAASALVAVAAALVGAGAAADSVQVTVSVAAGTLIGVLTFTGSLVALIKLQGFARWQPRINWFHRGSASLQILLGLALAGMYVYQPDWIWWLLGVALVAAVLGLALTLPIGGADMPVVISMLNSLSGVAAAATGFALGIEILVIAGSLVGVAGLILTLIMSRAMNRSLADVVLRNFGSAGTTSADVYDGRVTATSPDEVAMVLEVADSVQIVPGYGMAVAQAQHAVRELSDHLKAAGVKVGFAIHPVAGRMPGHMNVLLAEADVPYEELLELDQANPRMPQTDVAIVIGANDVVNPAAASDPGSPIFGMPILEAGRARTVVVIKRSLSPGFAGISNELFASENTVMLFGDGREMTEQLLRALKAG
ncbi:MAG: NAD(P)(+) transhydrogenase (Re/Si-specific) subunit beta [Chloroflexi bacterium]|nr:NAD(P)(+) transhydrogenase (Re/Si-specific) subunit beta [Chloroflexota bacterium]MDE2862121.1 NAD(P)(+) transhydrogenase (Re/Si-specific) subunit beta [Chloroflexota bacterium]MDE2936106.1 NAD(P)(+) transhydrogenase (Re/Si-specific) subunit beta [Chloroflexota bacterium]MXW27818.1 NAD(P)(+) transhydrogenase (Re/Si-specific) subunit beta [Chloroflexota bacterium]MXX99901.1 NAD(P)(+) transhydrogenase (Re/Si-specific) subunit beta [Chloroflexota bacterium]